MVLWLVSLLSALLSLPTLADPLTTIPDDVGLPHQWTWPAEGAPPSQPLPGICLDPPRALVPPSTTDYRGRALTSRRTSSTEALGVYANSRDARRAIQAWRRQVTLCTAPGALNHVGVPTWWYVERIDLDGADGSWQVREVTVPAEGQGEDLASTLLLTVARVHNAVYVETRYRSGRLDDASSARIADAVAASVTAYVPSLAVFATG